MKFLAIALLAITLLTGQLGFEVATIKPAAGTGGVRTVCHGIDSRFEPEDPGARVPLGRCVITSGRLSHIMSFAYGVVRVDGGPDWATMGDRFDIEAKAEGPANTTEGQLRTMLGNLLTERFKLKFHRETRELAGYVLTVAPGGAKFRESESKTTQADYGVESTIPLSTNRPPRRHDLGARLTLEAKRFSIAELQREMRNEIGGPTVDETGLTGYYDLKLTWDAGVSIVGPFKDQLGLQLEPRKIAVEFLVIDSAEKPDGN
jgi:uncharacterized protein (TIGR03435 family)